MFLAQLVNKNGLKQAPKLDEGFVFTRVCSKRFYAQQTLGPTLALVSADWTVNVIKVTSAGLLTKICKRTIFHDYLKDC